MTFSGYIADVIDAKEYTYYQTVVSTFTWILRYGQKVSSPCLQWDIALMEDIQRLARLWSKAWDSCLSYEERLRRLNLFFLERRRLRGDLILVYRKVHGRFDLPQSEVLEAKAERDIWGHDLKLAPPQFSLTSEESSLLCETSHLVE